MLLSLLLSQARAADGPPPVTVKVGGVLFAHYGYELTEGADGFNEFGIDRTYLNANATIGEKFGARLTLDSDRLKITDAAGEPADTKLRPYVKYAYLEYKGPAEGLKIRGGMIDTGYVGYYDDFWGHRFVGKHIADEAGILNTADFGVSIQGQHAKGLVSWHVAALNGEGYGKTEVDAGKTGQARITVDPLAPGGNMNLPITAFVSYGGEPSTDTTKLLYAGAVGFKMPYVVFWADYLGQSEGGVSGSAISVSAIPRIPKVAGLLLRYDMADPDTATADDGFSRLAAGPTKQLYDKVDLAVLYERTTQESAPTLPDHGLFVRAQAGF